MKTLTKIALTLFAVFAFTAANAQSDNSLIAKARLAAHDCLVNYNSSSFEINASIETTGICFVSGELHQVTFYAGPKCSGNVPCPAFVSVIIAVVDFDCEDNVTNVSCSTR